MNAGVPFDLIFIAFCTGLFMFVILLRPLSAPLALFVTFIKISIPTIYFALFFDGNWGFLDDWSYFNHGSLLIKLGYTPISVWFNLDVVRNLAGGGHILYYLVNLTAQYLFGEYYYSTVFINVALTCVTGLFFVDILKYLEFEEQYRKFYLVFFLLQWDVLAWSSFVNIKDVLVMTLTVVTLWLFYKLLKRFQVRYAAALLCMLYLFSMIRFYVPFLILEAIVIWSFLERKARWSYVLIPVIMLGVYIFFFFNGAPEHTLFKWGTIPFEFARHVLTPQPWSIDENYSFLLLPSILHWIFFIPTIYSIWFLIGRYSMARPLLIYFFILALFYAAVPDLNGPRERVQIFFILAWLQFHFLWLITNKSQTVFHAALTKNPSLQSRTDES